MSITDGSFTTSELEEYQHQSRNGITRRGYQEGNAAWGQNACSSQAIYAKGQASACCQVIRAWLSVTGVDELTVTCEVDALEQSFSLRALFEGTAFLTMEYGR